MTTNTFASLYRLLKFENKVVDQVDFGKSISKDGLQIGKSYINQLLNGRKPITDEIAKVVNQVYHTELKSMGAPKTKQAHTEPQPSELIMVFREFLQEQREDRKMFMGAITNTEVKILETRQDLNQFKASTDTRLQTDRLDILNHEAVLGALHEILFEKSQDYLDQTPEKRQKTYDTTLARHRRTYGIGNIASQSQGRKRTEKA